MNRFLTAAAALLGLALASPVAAQTASEAADWAGGYIGVEAGVVGGLHNQFDLAYEPGRDPQYTYIQNPPSRSLSRAADLDPAVSGAIRAGRLMNHGAFVWGGEVRVAVNQGHDITFDEIDGGAANTNFIPGIGGLNTTTDTLSADLKLGVTATAAARIGMPISDRLLVSVFAGPSVAQADLKVRQDSEFLSQLATLCAGCAHFSYTYTTTTGSAENSESDILFGGVAGYIVEFKLSDRWMLHGVGSLARYSEMEASTDGTNGADTRFSVTPTVYSATVGLSYRF